MMGLRGWMWAACLAGPMGAQASPPGGPVCVVDQSAWQRRALTCQVTADGTAQSLRFVARFSGGHDDTEASMALTLDGKPLACDPGSKLELMGEDGDVSLECRFRLAGPPGARRVLGADVKFRHAEYEGADVRVR